MQAKMLSMTDEFANIKKTKTSSVPFTPPRGGGSSSDPGQAKNKNKDDPFKHFPTAWGPPRPASPPSNTNPYFQPVGPSPFKFNSPKHSPAHSVSETGIVVNTVATVRCFSEDTRRPDVVGFIRALAAGVPPNTKCEEVYTPFKRCQFGCVKFNSACDMWQFIQNVNAAKKTNANTEVRARPRQSRRNRDALMHKFRRTLYRSENAP